MSEAGDDSWRRPDGESPPDVVSGFCASGRNDVSKRNQSHHRLAERNRGKAVAPSQPRASKTMVNKRTLFRAVWVFLTLICQHSPTLDISPHPWIFFLTVLHANPTHA